MLVVGDSNGALVRYGIGGRDRRGTLRGDWPENAMVLGDRAGRGYARCWSSGDKGALVRYDIERRNCQGAARRLAGGRSFFRAIAPAGDKAMLVAGEPWHSCPLRHRRRDRQGTARRLVGGLRKFLKRSRRPGTSAMLVAGDRRRPGALRHRGRDCHRRCKATGRRDARISGDRAGRGQGDAGRGEPMALLSATTSRPGPPRHCKAAGRRMRLSRRSRRPGTRR